MTKTTTLTTDWRDAAACKGAPLSVFYPPEGQGQQPPGHYRAASAYCDSCPVLDACGADALITDRLFGAHGYRAGMAPKERAQLRKGRR